jgi:hypothetical protein
MTADVLGIPSGLEFGVGQTQRPLTPGAGGVTSPVELSGWVADPRNREHARRCPCLNEQRSWFFVRAEQAAMDQADKLVWTGCCLCWGKVCAYCVFFTSSAASRACICTDMQAGGYHG